MMKIIYYTVTLGKQGIRKILQLYYLNERQTQT